MSLSTREEPEGRSLLEQSADHLERAADLGPLRARILAAPETVLEDPEIMAALLRRADPAGAPGDGRKVVDLRSALIERLEGRLDRLRRAHRDVVEAALDNLNGVEQAHQAVLALLEQDVEETLAARIRGRLPALLRLDEARLCLSLDDANGGLARRTSVASLRGASALSRLSERLRRRIQRWLAVDEPIERLKAIIEDDPLDPALVLLPGDAIRSRSPSPKAAARTDRSFIDGARRGAIEIRDVETADRMLLGPAVDRVASIAVVALDLGRGAGALVLGAAEPERLQSSHTIDLLAFLGGVIERLIRSADAQAAQGRAP